MPPAQHERQDHPSKANRSGAAMCMQRYWITKICHWVRMSNIPCSITANFSIDSCVSCHAHLSHTIASLRQVANYPERITNVKIVCCLPSYVGQATEHSLQCACKTAVWGDICQRPVTSAQTSKTSKNAKTQKHTFLNWKIKKTQNDF